MSFCERALDADIERAVRSAWSANVRNSFVPLLRSLGCLSSRRIEELRLAVQSLYVRASQ
jgi:hypothetical protein